MKILSAFLLSLIIMMSSIGVTAQETLFRSGYTDEGIYYELYFAVMNEEVSSCAEGVKHITLRVTYDYITIPASTLYWEEEVDGEVYAGNLKLDNYMFSGNKTIVTYVGDLYKQ